ncbi:hypothetical protein KQX54_011418 [Cotesia glomerata]|uniref:Myosin motor domain-containing protein n=1 Tax=Cotesia glomerata TaxID=32391 RepID=A0AAV7IED7_COTGL|nr:hypothetical protein KQX54_011418 [Cotesia glomerata]
MFKNFSRMVVKKRDRARMSAKKLLRLDKVYKSLKKPGRCKEKEKSSSGVTVGYSCTDKSFVTMKLPKNDDGVINVPLLCSQIRGRQIIDAMRLHKVGFLTYLPFGKFRRRFGLLFNDYAANVRSSSPVEDERRVVTDMLLTMDVDAASYRVGQSQIFFRAGALERIESQRDEKLTGPIVLLQARCRGYLARKKLNTLKEKLE